MGGGAAGLLLDGVCRGRGIYLLPPTADDNPHRGRLPALGLHDAGRQGQAAPVAKQRPMEEVALGSFFYASMKTILWEYRLNFSGLIEAGPSLSQARQALIDDLRANPERYISGLKPIAATDNVIVDLSKRLLGLK